MSLQFSHLADRIRTNDEKGAIKVLEEDRREPHLNACRNSIRVCLWPQLLLATRCVLWAPIARPPWRKDWQLHGILFSSILWHPLVSKPSKSSRISFTAHNIHAEVESSSKLPPFGFPFGFLPSWCSVSALHVYYAKDLVQQEAWHFTAWHAND